MAYQYDVNNAVGANGGAEAMFALKTLLVAAGWSVASSGGGTGSGLFNAAGDVVTTAAIFNNSRAWVRLRAPAAMAPRREFCIQHGSGGGAGVNWWIKVSAEDGFTGGAADEDDMPTALDEQNLHGAGTAGTALFAAAATFNYHAAADDASPYGFYLFSAIMGTGVQDMAFVFEPLVTATFPPEDDDPALYYARQGSPFALATIGAAASAPFGWYAKDDGGEAWVRMPACVWYDGGGTNRQFPGVGTNPNVAKDDTAPIAYIRGAFSFATQIGVKGFAGTVMRWLGTTRANLDTLTVSTARDRVVMGNISLPWDGSVPIV